MVKGENVCVCRFSPCTFHPNLLHIYTRIIMNLKTIIVGIDLCNKRQESRNQMPAFGTQEI